MTMKERTMKKQTIVYLLLITFAFFNVSCLSLREVDVNAVKKIEKKSGEKVRIYSLVTVDGKWMKFSKRNAATLEGKNITGRVVEGFQSGKDVVIPVSKVKSVNIKRVNAGKTILGIIGAVGVLTGTFLILIISNMGRWH